MCLNINLFDIKLKIIGCTEHITGVLLCYIFLKWNRKFLKRKKEINFTFSKIDQPLKKTECEIQNFILKFHVLITSYFLQALFFIVIFVNHSTEKKIFLFENTVIEILRYIKNMSVWHLYLDFFINKISKSNNRTKNVNLSKFVK